MEIIWKDIPGLGKYQASNTGLIRTKLTGHIKAQQEVWVKKGYYLEVSLSDDQCKENTYRVHRLVCSAFHGEPSNKSLVVNHKDLDKTNNNEDNLEWVTRKRNAEHMFENGAHLGTTKVRMYDLLDKKSIDFNTTKELEKYFNIRHTTGIFIAGKHQKIPYLDRYTFEFPEGYNPPTRKTDQEFYGLDLVNGTFNRFENATQLQIALGINRVTANNVKTPRLLNGIVFCEVEKVNELMTFIGKLTQEEIDKSLIRYKKYHAVERKWARYSWLVKNYLTGEITKIDSTQELRALKPFKHIKQLPVQAIYKLYRGHSFKRTIDLNDFLDYNEDYVKFSLTNDVNIGIPIIVTNLISNTTEIWSTPNHFAKSVKLNTTRIQDINDLRRRFKNTHSFEKVKILN